MPCVCGSLCGYLVTVCSKKQHFPGKYHLNLIRMSYGTPLEDFDNMCYWSTNVKEQHYATHPARDAVANTLGFASANAYYIPRADLNPENMPEFQKMVNKVFPWLGQAFAHVVAVSDSGHLWTKGCSLDSSTVKTQLVV